MPQISTLQTAAQPTFPRTPSPSLGLFALFVVLSIWPAVTLAEVRVVTAQGEYRMGERDSREDAIRLATEAAKRNALEQVAVYLESVTIVNGLDVTKDEIRSYTAGLVLVLDQATNTRLDGNTIIITTDLVAQIETEEVKQAIAALRENEDARQQLVALQQENDQLQQDLDAANQALAQASTTEQTQQAALRRQDILNRVQSNAMVSQAWTDWVLVSPTLYPSSFVGLAQIQALLNVAQSLSPTNQHVRMAQQVITTRQPPSPPQPPIPPEPGTRPPTMPRYQITPAPGATAGPGTGYTYSLNSGPYQASGNFTGLAAGNYTVSAMNANGCTGTSSITIGTNNPCAGVTVAVTATKTDPTTGQSNGSITATATGGTGFTYSLNNGPFQASGNFTGLAAGNYTITAKNSNGCTGATTVTLTGVNPCAGVTVTVTLTKTDPTTGQSNGTITATATGGSGFTYSLNNGAYQASGSFTGLATGNYTVTAKNSNGCTGVATIALGSTNPCAGVTITVTATTTAPSQGNSDGSITASATGGTGFTYSLNNGTFQASPTFSGLAAGTYTVTAKSAAGCLGSTTVTLTATNPCAGVTVTVTTTKVDPTGSQANGSITASATGGSGFTYSINNGSFQAVSTFTGLAAGTYTITAKNSNGCTGSTTVTLTAQPCTNTSLIITTVIVNVMPCASPAANGKITVTATGSTSYTYNINNGTYQASNVFSNLSAATYTIGVKDANGCTNTATATVGTATRGPLFAAVRSLITARCSGSNCHMNGQSASGYNFDNDCSIVTYWSAIKTSTVTNGNMPKYPQASFNATEKATITNWVNAGHTYGN